MSRRIRDSMMPKSQYNSYPKKFILELLNIYKNHPCLWKSKSEEYFDREKKDRAYEVIVEKLQEVENFPDRRMAIALFSALRFYYRKQLKLVEQGKKPTLWYFHHLDFIRNYLYSNRRNNSIGIIIADKTQTNEKCENEDENENENKADDSSPHSTRQTSWNNEDVSIDSTITSNAEISYASPSHSESLSAYRQYEDSIIVEQPSAQYFEELASAWATILKGITPQQQIIVEKLVNDILYEAHMNKLTDQLPLDILDILDAKSCASES